MRCADPSQQQKSRKQTRHVWLTRRTLLFHGGEMSELEGVCTVFIWPYTSAPVWTWLVMSGYISHATEVKSATYFSLCLVVTLFFSPLYPPVSILAFHHQLLFLLPLLSCMTSITPTTHLHPLFFFSHLSGTRGELQRCGWMNSRTSTTLLFLQREMSPMESKCCEVLAPQEMKQNNVAINCVAN